MQLSNRERVGRGLDAVRKGLIPHVRAELVRLYGANWEQHGRASLRNMPQSGDGLNLDVTALVAIILDPAHAAFRTLRGQTAKNWVFEVRASRNAYAHQDEFSDRDTDRALDTMELVLEAVASVEASTVRNLRRQGDPISVAAPAAPLHVAANKSPSTTAPLPRKTVTPAIVGVLEPDPVGYERGVKLFRFLAAEANRGRAVGLGYASFIEYLHNKPFLTVMGRPYAQSDTGPVIEIAKKITRRAGRIPVTRRGTSIDAGMDTFIWPLKKPHERSDSSWKSGLPYTKEEWRSVFPDHLRELMSFDELNAKIKS